MCFASQCLFIKRACYLKNNIAIIESRKVTLLFGNPNDDSNLFGHDITEWHETVLQNHLRFAIRFCFLGIVVRSSSIVFVAEKHKTGNFHEKQENRKNLKLPL